MAIILWAMIAIYMYFVIRVAITHGRFAILAAFMGGITWGIVLAIGAAALFALSNWRKKRDSLNTRFLYSTAAIALVPFAFALGFLLTAKFRAPDGSTRSSTDERNTGQLTRLSAAPIAVAPVSKNDRVASVILRVEPQYLTREESYHVDAELANPDLATATSSPVRAQTFFDFQSSSGIVVSKGTLSITSPRHVDIQMSIKNQVPLKLDVGNLLEVSIREGDQMHSRPALLQPGNHALTVIGTVKEKSWSDGSTPADYASIPAASDGTYRGRPVEDWIEGLQKGLTAELSVAGPDCLPVFEKAAQDREAAVWVRHILSVRDEPWEWRVYLAMLQGDSPMNRTFAMNELSQLDPESRRQAAPRLVQLALRWAVSKQDEEQRLATAAINVLLKQKPLPDRFGELVLRAWPITSNFDRQELIEEAEFLGQSGVTLLIDLAAAGEASLGNLSDFLEHANKEIITAVINESRSEQADRRRIAKSMIMMAASKKSLHALYPLLHSETTRLLSDSDASVQYQALRMIDEDLPDDIKAEAMPIVASMLGGDDVTLRSTAAATLASCREIALPTIEQALHSQQPEVRTAACWALRSMEPFPESHLSVLLRLRSDDQPEVRRAALALLADCIAGNADALAAMVDALQDEEVRMIAGFAIGKLGPQAQAVLDDLYRLLESDDPAQRLLAAKAVWDISQDADRVLPVARSAVRERQEVVLAGYNYSYQRINKKRLRKEVAFSISQTRFAATLLGEMGSAAAPAVSDLVSLLGLQDQRTRLQALTSLGRIGPDAAEAVPAILEHAVAEPKDAENAIKALQQIDPAVSATLAKRLSD